MKLSYFLHELTVAQRFKTDLNEFSGKALFLGKNGPRISFFKFLEKSVHGTYLS